MRIKIQLNNRPAEEKVNVDLQWSVQVTSPKGGLLPKVFRKHNRIIRDLKISVSPISVPDDIVCDKEKLFSILYKEKLYSQSEFPVNIQLKDTSTPFQLLFNQGEIKDCKVAQDADPRSYDIGFKVDLKDMDGTIIKSTKEKIQIIFDPLGVKPKYKIDLDEGEIQYYASLGKKKVGTFVAWIDEDFKFTPKQLASISLKLYRETVQLPAAISFKDNDIKDAEDITIEGGKKKAKKLPIYIDFSTISNPIDSFDDFTIESSIVQSAGYSPEIKETILEQEHFKLLKDEQGTELKVFTQKGGAVPEVWQEHLTIPLQFVPRSRLQGQVDVVLSNIATDNSNPKAGLYIKNLTLTEKLVGGVQVIGENNTTLNQLVSIDGPDVDDMSGGDGLFIPNGDDAKTKISIFFNPSYIVDVLGATNYDFQLLSTLSFDYWEDKDGLGMTAVALKSKSLPITWQLHLAPNPEWLCVDYGSSAIVCSYDNVISK